LHELISKYNIILQQSCYYNYYFPDLQSCVRADTQPVLQILSLSDCSLTNEFWEILAALVQGRQLPIREIDVGANGDLTASSLKTILGITSGNFC